MSDVRGPAVKRGGGVRHKLVLDFGGWHMSAEHDEKIHDSNTNKRDQNLQLSFGYEKDESFLAQVIELDELVYPASMSGNLDAMLGRFRVENDQFIFVEDGDVLAGYINFFPMTPALRKSVFTASGMRDDDIEPSEIQKFSNEVNHLFILSVVVREEYRNGEAIKNLMQAFTNYLREKDEQGLPIASISGAVVSEDGEKLMRGLWFECIKEIDAHSILYVCEGDNLKRLKMYAYYRPSYQSDLFIMTPLYVAGSVGISSKLPVQSATSEAGNAYIKTVSENAEYECSNAVIEDLTRLCLGEYKLAVLTDDYDTENILDWEDAQLILTSHKKTELHVLTVIVAENKHSTTQLEDQMSTGNLIIHNDANGTWVNLFEYMESTYGLKICGEAKALVCASNKPADKAETCCILCAETYNSVHVDYHIDCSSIQEMCGKNLAKYDYYEVYMFMSVLLFIPKVFASSFLERLSTEATYIFVLELAMFQTAAIQRTNERVTKELSSDNTLSIDFIEALYEEFGSTILFWSPKNFKYKMAQAEAEQINQAFKTQENLDTFYRNQNYLERLIDLRNASAEKHSSRIVNIALFALAMLQVIPLVGVFIEWVFEMQNWPEHGIPATVGSATLSVVILGVLLVVMLFRERRRKLRERSRRQGKRRF